MSDAAGLMILAVDDKPDELRGEMVVGLRGRARFDIVHPREVTLHHLEKADLVLVDVLLEDWPERDEADLAMTPVSGLALAVVLRDHVDQSTTNRLTAFALHSAHLDQVRGRLPAGSGEHVLARLNNLEWAFSKADGDRWQRMVVLANAVRQLPLRWPEGAAAETEALKLLALGAETWFDRARRNVRACQPPIHDLSGGAHELLFVRWILQQIMPYPCFLWQEEWVAARLRLTLASLGEILREQGQLVKDLDAMTYKGVLAGFLGPRWWRSGLEEYVWNLTSGKSADVETLHAALRERTGVQFEPLTADASIVCLGTNFAPTGEFLSAEAAVRLRPDQWPAFADDAWTSIARAREDAFVAAIVDPLDASRLDVAEDHG